MHLHIQGGTYASAVISLDSDQKSMLSDTEANTHELLSYAAQSVINTE